MCVCVCEKCCPYLSRCSGILAVPMESKQFDSVTFAGVRLQGSSRFSRAIQRKTEEIHTTAHSHESHRPVFPKNPKIWWRHHQQALLFFTCFSRKHAFRCVQKLRICCGAHVLVHLPSCDLDSCVSLDFSTSTVINHRRRISVQDVVFGHTLLVVRHVFWDTKSIPPSMQLVQPQRKSKRSRERV